MFFSRVAIAAAGVIAVDALADQCDSGDEMCLVSIKNEKSFEPIEVDAGDKELLQVDSESTQVGDDWLSIALFNLVQNLDDATMDAACSQILQSHDAVQAAVVEGAGLLDANTLNAACHTYFHDNVIDQGAVMQGAIAELQSNPALAAAAIMEMASNSVL